MTENFKCVWDILSCMSLSTNTNVMATDHGDGSADFTVSFADEDHKFSAAASDGKAVVQYEETLSWRGQIRVSEPDDDIFRELMVSDEMTEFLEENDLTAVRRERR